MIRTVECDETLAGTGLNVSHMMEGNQTDWKQSREASWTIKRTGKIKYFLLFIHMLRQFRSSNILIWGDTAPGSEKGKLHSLSHCDSGVDKYHTCLRNKVGDTKITHEALINGVNCRYDMNQQQWERGHWHGRVMRQQQALLSEWGRFYRHRPVVTASYFSCSTPNPSKPLPALNPPLHPRLDRSAMMGSIYIPWREAIDWAESNPDAVL